MLEQTFHLTDQQFLARTSQHITRCHSDMTLQSRAGSGIGVASWLLDAQTQRLPSKDSFQRCTCFLYFIMTVSVSLMSYKGCCGNHKIYLLNVSALLHDVLTKLEIVMEQQRNIVRMVQELKENNIGEITEADLFFWFLLCKSTHLHFLLVYLIYYIAHLLFLYIYFLHATSLWFILCTKGKTSCS